DLVDAACLAHDLGHPPFGHNGESALAALADPGGPLACGGFEGNAQSLRLLTRLEPKVPGAALNLTRATLDAALKYPWLNAVGGPASLAAAKNLTSELVGRFCQAAWRATRAAAGDGPLARYAADLVVPRRQLLECALLKAVTAHYVMGRGGAAAQQAREREVI